MTVDKTAEPKSYRIEVYLVAAFAALIASLPADQVREIGSFRDMDILFQREFSRKLSNERLSETVDLMNNVGLLIANKDKYAGDTIVIQKTAFTNALRELAAALPGSPVEIYLKSGRNWIDKVFSSEQFWEDLEEYGFDDDDDDDAVDLAVRSTTAGSEQEITLVSGSPERKDIESSMDVLADALRTNNEIAAQLGSDRDRIVAEFESSRIGIKSDKIRVGYIRDLVLKNLREISQKLKDKAIELGVDKLILIFETLLDKII